MHNTRRVSLYEIRMLHNSIRAKWVSAWNMKMNFIKINLVFAYPDSDVSYQTMYIERVYRRRPLVYAAIDVITQLFLLEHSIYSFYFSLILQHPHPHTHTHILWYFLTRLFFIISFNFHKPHNNRKISFRKLDHSVT